MVNITVQSFIDQIQNKNYVTEMLVTTKEELMGEQAPIIIQNFTQRFSDLILENNLVRLELLVEDVASVTKIVLESGIINLPFANTKVVDSFFPNLEAGVPLLLNLIVESKDLNPSGLHIKTMGAVSEILPANEVLLAELQTKIQIAITTILTNEQLKTEQPALTAD